MRSEFAASDRSRVSKPSHLHWRFRVAVGLHKIGITDMAVYARSLGFRTKRGCWDVAKAAKFVANALVSRNPVMRMVIEDGLTVDSAVTLRNHTKVRCPVCGTNLTEIPCHLCTTHRQEVFRGILPDSDDDTDEWLEQWFTAEEPVVLPTATDVPPGTKEKVKLLASRFNRDELLHHPDDRKLDTEYIRPWELRDTMSLKYPGMVARKEPALAA